MSLKQRIDEDMKRALKARDQAALTAVRMLKSAITNREIELGKEADDAEVLRLIEKQIKQRRESAQVYRQNNRPELAEAEEREAAFLGAYLPARLSDAEVEALVAEALAEVGAKSMKDMGPAMKAAQARAAGRVDARTLSEVVKRKLSTP